MQRKWFTTSGRHVAPLECAPLRIDRMCRSKHPVSSLRWIRKALVSDTPKVSAFFTNLVRKSITIILSFALTFVPLNVAWNGFIPHKTKPIITGLNSNLTPKRCYHAQVGSWLHQFNYYLGRSPNTSTKTRFGNFEHCLSRAINRYQNIWRTW